MLTLRDIIAHNVPQLRRWSIRDAAQLINLYTRQMISRASILRMIFPPMPITNDDIAADCRRTDERIAHGADTP
jgi:hypothetical protein